MSAANYSADEVREGLAGVADEIEALLSDERGADGTYETSAIEIALPELLNWLSWVRRAVAP